MTKPHNDRDAAPDLNPRATPSGQAPSWVEGALQASRAAPAPRPAPAEAGRPEALLSGPDDLRLPGDQPAAPGGGLPRASLRPPAASHNAAPSAEAPFDADDWIARATGGSARSPRVPQAAARPAYDQPRAAALQEPWGEPLPQPGAAPLSPYRPVGAVSGDVTQKKLIAGLLGIFLGGLGVHKFYLGLTGAGLTMLGVQLGVWMLAVVVGLLLFVVGLALTLPLAGLVSGAVGLLGLIEGILYLTKSDADFEREYLIGKKPWL